MAVTGARRKKRTDLRSPEVRKLLSHPWRVRIMEILDSREMSCSQVVDEGLIPDSRSLPRADAISNLAYHFRLLLEGDLIEVVRSVPIRGSVEHICRAKSGAHHDDEEWAKLSRAERAAITPMTLSSFTGLAEVAVHYGTFDNRVDRHLAYLPMDLDEQGWKELGPVLNGVLDIVIRVRDEAKERLEETSEAPIRATWGQMLFESPPMPPAE